MNIEWSRKRADSRAAGGPGAKKQCPQPHPDEKNDSSEIIWSEDCYLQVYFNANIPLFAWPI